MSNTAPAVEKPKKLPLPVKLVVGAAAGVVGTTCIFPIDMVKTRLQASALYSNPFQAFRGIFAKEGIRGFYQGLPANLVGVTPEKAIKLAANEFFREHFEREDGSIALHHEMISGAGAGFCQVIATNPMEIVKIRMQMQATLPVTERQGTMAVVRSLGLRGLYTGTPATLMRDVPFSLLFFPGYANIKAALADKQGNNSLPTLLAAGGLSGAMSSICVTPFDMVKTRLQLSGGKERYGNMMNCFATVFKEEGFLALFNGAIPRAVVVGPLFAITLVAFEMQKSYMIKHGLL
eukprot:CAMPEP_0182417416 /NCGR_PEP_ID=MMETSP1167-20130531/1867_1 /TAXON_ID=2988 /ORGANISM="Mallomonas Sp, Strain CCMP3275" /LENGTH=290 /DNA_ID=CAMNT_0024590983 /DNA_START=68 /DNA_END=940 /DNA_ORIENTATION=-